MCKVTVMVEWCVSDSDGGVVCKVTVMVQILPLPPPHHLTCTTYGVVFAIGNTVGRCGLTVGRCGLSAGRRGGLAGWLDIVLGEEPLEAPSIASLVI